MDLDSDGIDEEAADAPARLVAQAVVGLAVAAVGLVALVLGLAGFRPLVVDAVPLLGVVFDLSVPLLVVGVGVFFVTMTEWDPDVGT